MNEELTKRVITSIILFIFTIFLCIYVNQFFFLIALFIILYIGYDEWRKISSNKTIRSIGFAYLSIFAISTFLLKGDSLESSIFFTFILSICICSDIGGYVFGKIIGGIKLTRISPKKTVSGSVGSFAFSLLPIFLFSFAINPFYYLDIYSQLSIKKIFLCLFVSLSCQLGDLTISYFKRINKVKDTGTILPGHGGLLDRIDGIILAIPLVYILIITGIF